MRTPTQSFTRRLVAAALVTTAVACAGTPGPVPEVAEPAPDRGLVAQCAAAPSTLRRLTREEYNAAVHDLVGDTSAPAEHFPPDENLMGYATGAAVSPMLVQLYRDAAEDIAETAVTERLPALLAPCGEPATHDAACAGRVLTDLASRAYRQPIDEATAARLMRVYEAGAAEGAGFEAGLTLAISAVLQSPRFLYLIESSEEPEGEGPIPLTDHERAARLSLFLWGSVPDEALRAAADAGALRTRLQVEVQARRMLRDPRARRALGEFFAQWLELDVEGADKDPALFPDWSPELARSMDESVRRYFEHVVFESQGTLNELLTSRTAFVDAQLASVYGVEAPAGEGMHPVTLPAAERAGLLTQAAILAQRALPDDGSPIRRGKLVRERFFCTPLPPPPDGLATVPPSVDPDSTTRERYQRHVEDPICASCHMLMDPLGFTFDRYDSIGRHRLTENGRTIDVSAVVFGTRNTDGPVNGTVELVTRMAGSPDVRNCFAQQVFRFALRRLDGDGDECALSEIQARFAASGGDIRELMVAIAVSEPFLFRGRLSESEGAATQEAAGETTVPEAAAGAAPTTSEVSE